MDESSVQERAEKLLAEADVVHQSNHERKEMLKVMMDEKVFDSNSSSLNHDSTQSFGDMSAAGESKKDKKSRFQTVSELKQQVQDGHKALLTTKENAGLKYRKLELQAIETKAALEATKNDLEGANADLQNLENEKQMLQESLQKAIGKDQAEWLERTKLRTKELEEKLVAVERDLKQSNKHNEIMKNTMTCCSQCSKHVPRRPESTRNVMTATTPATSWWGSVSSAFMGLNEEAEATPASPAKQGELVNPKPPQEMFQYQEQTHQIKEDLEADIEAMERQMKDDVDALKNEWSKEPSKGSSRRTRHRKKHRKSKERSQSINIIGGLGSLDAFFASATHGLSLESEEMDEEASFYGSRSVASAPVVGRRRRKKKSHGSSSHRHTHRKSSSTSEDSKGGAETNRRGTYGATGRSMSFRDNFKASLLGLGEEVSAEQKDAEEESDRFNDLQREVAEWSGGANRAMTVL